MAGVKITLFLPKGDAQSLRTAQIGNWTGLALACPRSEIDDLLSREEINKAGIYFLIGTQASIDKPKAYIGEGEDVGKRLKQHREKEFWVQAVVFVSTDENLTKSHIRYLEGRTIEEATKIGSFALENDQISGAKLPEADREDMEVFLTRISQLLPVLGCNILSPLFKPESKSASSEMLTCKAAGVTARGQRTANGFVVYKDSEARPKNQPSAPKWVIMLRDKLIANGSLVQVGDRFKFTKDVEFASPSAAAAAIKGRATNGLTSWLAGNGKTLKDLDLSVFDQFNK